MEIWWRAALQVRVILYMYITHLFFTLVVISYNTYEPTM